MPKELENKFRNMSFVAACLVVAQHTAGLPKWMGSITALAVPWFFFASGFLYNRVTLPKSGHLGYRFLTLKKLKSLLVPYVVWNVIYWLFLLTIAFAYRMVGRDYDAMGWVSFSPEVFLGVLTVPCLPPTWFLSALFCIFLVAPLLAGVLKNSKIAYAVGAVAVSCLFFLDRSDLWTDRCLLGLVWFVIGILFSRFDLLEGGSLWKRIVFSGVCTLAVGALLMGKGGGLFFCVWIFISAKNWPFWMTGNSFHIYLVHYFFVLILSSKDIAGVFTLLPLDALFRLAVVLGASVITVQSMRCLLPKPMVRFMFGAR